MPEPGAGICDHYHFLDYFWNSDGGCLFFVWEPLVLISRGFEVGVEQVHQQQLASLRLCT